MAETPSKLELQELARATLTGRVEGDNKASLESLAAAQDQILSHAINKNFAHLALPGLLSHGHFAQKTGLSVSREQLKKMANSLNEVVNNDLKKSASNMKDNDVKPTTPSKKGGPTG